MNRTSLDYLEDILEYTKKALEFVEGIDYAAFEKDDKTNFAVLRALEVVGEATKHVPPDIRVRFPGIPWEDMAGMRDKLIHVYFGVDLKVVWDTATIRVPKLVPLMQRVVSDLRAEEGDD